ncbi:hypothetical protein PQX77_021134 [Marasmius sp. AFHP31]|nr:hypothetical protein PQX77_021134 [Marasmius sp. AFHP31]
MSSDDEYRPPPPSRQASIPPPMPEFVEGSSSSTQVETILNPPAGHHIGTLMTLEQWRGMVVPLLANGQARALDKLNELYGQQPLLRPRDTVEEHSREFGVEQAFNRLRYRLELVPPPFRPAAHISPDAMYRLAWVYLATVVNTETSLDYGANVVPEELHPFLPNRPAIVELLRMDPSHIQAFEFGPLAVDTMATNIQKTGGMDDLIPEIVLEPCDPGGSARTGIKINSDDDEDDLESPQYALFPGVVRPRAASERRPRKIKLSRNPFDAVYLDPGMVPIGLEYPPRLDIPVPLRYYHNICRKLYVSVPFANKARPKFFELFSSTNNDVNLRAGWWYFGQAQLHARMTAWDLALMWGFVDVSPRNNLYHSTINKNSMAAMKKQLSTPLVGNHDDLVAREIKDAASRFEIKDVDYWTREFKEGRVDRFVRLAGGYSEKKLQQQRDAKEKKEKRVQAKKGKGKGKGKDKGTEKEVPPSTTETVTPRTRRKAQSSTQNDPEHTNPEESSTAVKIPPSSMGTSHPSLTADSDSSLTVRLPGLAPNVRIIAGADAMEERAQSAGPVTRSRKGEEARERIRTLAQTRGDRDLRRVVRQSAELRGMSGNQQSGIAAGSTSRQRGDTGRRLLMNSVEIPRAPSFIRRSTSSGSRGPQDAPAPMDPPPVPQQLFLSSESTPDPPSYAGAFGDLFKGVKKPSPPSSSDPGVAVLGSSLPVLSGVSASGPDDVEDIRSSVAPTESELSDYESDSNDLPDPELLQPMLEYPANSVPPPMGSARQFVDHSTQHAIRYSTAATQTLVPDGPSPSDLLESNRSLELTIRELQLQNEGLSREARQAETWRCENANLRSENARLTTLVRDGERAHVDLRERNENLNRQVQNQLAAHENRRSEIERLAQDRIRESTTYSTLRFNLSDIPRLIRVAERNVMSSAGPILGVLTAASDHHSATVQRLREEIRLLENRSQLVSQTNVPGGAPQPPVRTANNVLEELALSASSLNSLLGRARMGYNSIMDANSRAHDVDFMERAGSRMRHGLIQTYELSPSGWLPAMIQASEGLISPRDDPKVGDKRKERDDDDAGSSGQGSRKK